MRLDGLPQRLVAEGLGTALLVATVVGSGIMAERLCGGDDGLALLCNTLATGAGLVALILTFGPISGAHLNPVVSAALAVEGGRPRREFPAFAIAQVLGGLFGVAVANLMFDLPAWAASTHARTGAGQWLGEFVATFGLLATILVVSRRSPSAAPYAVAAWITAAYWFTASTSFANPAVTVARALTDTFAGVRPADVPAFVLAQLAGAACAVGLLRWLLPGGGRD